MRYFERFGHAGKAAVQTGIVTGIFTRDTLFCNIITVTLGT